jgi:hypothetical protein
MLAVIHIQLFVVIADLAVNAVPVPASPFCLQVTPNHGSKILMCPSKNLFPDEKSIYLRNPLSIKKMERMVES